LLPMLRRIWGEPTALASAVATLLYSRYSTLYRRLNGTSNPVPINLSVLKSVLDRLMVENPNCIQLTSKIKVKKMLNFDVF
jgi:hypothetical protein